MRYHSQCGEDKWIIENLKPEPGIFIEIGAFDGIQSSNTIAFEDMGWDGVLVEPDPFLSTRSQETRKALSLCCAADAYDGFTSITIDLQDRGLSGSYVLPKGLSRKMRCPCFRVSTIVSWHFQKVDLLSIDTEGTELHVWSGVHPLRPKIVIIEYQTCDRPPMDKPIIERLTGDGYREVHRTQYNLIFTRD